MTDSTSEAALTIDCDRCVLQHTPSCDDCLVTFLCRSDAASAEPAPTVVVDADEARALRLLAGAGLVPRLRLVQAGPAA